MQVFFNHIELWLTAAGVMAIVASPALVGADVYSPHAIMAVTATVVGVLDGVAIWAIRRRQRQVRRAAIEDIQWMLADRVNSEVTLVLLSLADGPTADAEHLQRLALVKRSIRDTSALIGSLRDEPLQPWQHRQRVAG